jgi:hypothetical protein
MPPKKVRKQKNVTSEISTQTEKDVNRILKKETWTKRDALIITSALATIAAGAIVVNAPLSDIVMTAHSTISNVVTSGAVIASVEVTRHLVSIASNAFSAASNYVEGYKLKAKNFNESERKNNETITEQRHKISTQEKEIKNNDLELSNIDLKKTMVKNNAEHGKLEREHIDTVKELVNTNAKSNERHNINKELRTQIEALKQQLNSTTEKTESEKK